MSRLRIAYVLSLAVLVVLLGFAVGHPMVSGTGSSEVLRQQLLQTEDEWIVQLDIVNREGRDVTYAIDISVNGQPYSHIAVLEDGQHYGYAHHIYKARVGQGDATLAVYKDGTAAPIGQTSYHLTGVP